MTLVRSKGEPVAPSWSWASVTGALEHRKAQLHDSNKGMTLTFECNVTESAPETFGQLSGDLTVTGLLQEVVVNPSDHPGERKRAFQECGIESGFVNSTNVLCSLDEPAAIDQIAHKCWCLRVGSYDAGGREADAGLLLSKAEALKDAYYRIGYAEADAWFDRLAETPNSGQFSTCNPRRIRIL